ncbi:hypothetical protein NLX83_36350 [Allokutzneria sp. A3M-2-11 16]|uniref:hypothetical protein n=1 Tax=Allokutzneria sp. A3M-2-11 16 TaxID=2962043 RepID=UPI0020B89CF6|nr:hypothetical protein [Allokutzneria sp. A3M-2-11 16]MCP3804752.1 hypothetical protein [Allokutzneria sp. A3M-2-11 16]
MMRTSERQRPLLPTLLVLLAALAALGLASPAFASVPDDGDQHARHVVSELAHPSPTLRGRQHAHAVPVRGYLATGPVLIALLPPAEPVPEPLAPLGDAPQDRLSGSFAEPTTAVGSRAPPPRA